MICEATDYYGVRGEFGWVGFLVVCFQYKTNPNPQRKKIAVGKNGPNATFDLFFLGWVGLGLVSSSVFHNDIYVFSHPTEIGEFANTLL